MPEIRLGRSYHPDILVCIHRSTGKDEYVNLGKQFAEGHARSTYTTASSHVYTCMNREVACSLNMFTLMRSKGDSIDCYEYTVTLTIDDRPAGRMTASANEIRRCNHFIVTPSRTLYEDQGTFTIRVKEKQIKPIYHEDERMTTTNFKIEYMYFLRPLVKFDERLPLNGHAYDHIPRSSWRLWDREEEEERERSLIDRIRPSYDTLCAQAGSPSMESRSSSKLASRISDRQSDIQIQNQTATANDDIEQVERIAVTPPRTASTPRRLESPPPIKQEGKAEGMIVEETLLATSTKNSSAASKRDLPEANPSADVAEVLPATSQPESLVSQEGDQGSIIKAEYEETVLSRSTTPPPPPPSRPACLGLAIKAVSIERSSEVIVEQPIEVEVQDGVAESNAGAISISDGLSNKEDTIMTSVPLEESQASSTRDDLVQIDAGKDLLDKQPIAPATLSVAVQTNTNEKKRSAPSSSEESLERRKQRVEEMKMKLNRREIEALEIEVEELALKIEVQEAKNRQRQKNCAEARKFLKHVNSKGVAAAAAPPAPPQDPRRSVANVGEGTSAGASQRRVAGWIQGEEEITYRGGIPSPPMSSPSPRVVYNGSPPHYPKATSTAMPAPSLPKPMMRARS